MKISIISPNLSGCVSILDCGVTYLATYINERTSHSATIWDYTFKRKEWRSYIKSKFHEENPDVIGITFTTLYKKYVIDTVNEIRANISRDIPIIVGGYHATLRPRESISIPGVNAVAIGEGEYILENYLDALSSNSDLSEVKGLAYKNPEGKLIENPRETWIKDINGLPFPNYELWEDIDTYFYFLGQLWLIGSRGCPYFCTNCEELYIRESVPGNRYRVRNPKNYVDEIVYHYKKFHNRGFRMAHPFDPVFPINKKWTEEFCHYYIKSGLSKKLPFSIFARGDTFYIREEGDKVRDKFDEERLKFLAEAGCKEIRIGLEAGTERMRNEIHQKNVANKQMEETFKYCHKYGVITIAYNMLGGPTETREEMIETFKMNRRVKANKPIFFIYQTLAHEVEVPMAGEFSCSSNYPDIANPEFKEKSERSDEDQATIQFGEPINSETFSKRWVIYFQLFCYAYVVGRRVIRLALKQRFVFFKNFAVFMYKGYKKGANMKIVFAYFLSSCGDNLFD